MSETARMTVCPLAPTVQKQPTFIPHSIVPCVVSYSTTFPSDTPSAHSSKPSSFIQKTPVMTPYSSFPTANGRPR